MQQITINGARWQQDSEGTWLALRVKSQQTAMDVCDAMKPGKEYNVTIKGKGRSLDANAYCWVLLDRLAAHYGILQARGVPAGDTEHRRRERGALPAGKGGGCVL